MNAIENALLHLTDSVHSVLESDPVSGGCISEARRVRVRCTDSREENLFVKSNDLSFVENFRCESAGLDQLSAAGAIAVPRPLACGEHDGRAWLVMQWVESGRRGSGFFAHFGRALAELHQATLGQAIGWERNNFLGSARQINRPTERWSDFVAEHRLGFQLRWAVDQGLTDATLRRDAERIIESMDQRLAGREDATSLLHGDLWSGNYLCDANGDPVIIDPAVYRGCREAEFGMLKLFGSCPQEFYEAYQHAFPMPAGWQRRTDVYVLYHLLNHLNLFGTGYLSGCRSMAAKLLS